MQQAHGLRQPCQSGFRAELNSAVPWRQTKTSFSGGGQERPLRAMKSCVRQNSPVSLSTILSTKTYLRVERAYWLSYAAPKTSGMYQSFGCDIPLDMLNPERAWSHHSRAGFIFLTFFNVVDETPEFEVVVQTLRLSYTCRGEGRPL